MKVGKITDEIKEQILDLNDLREVAEEYGILFNSSNKATCPFHNDGVNGNLHIHEKKEQHATYHCYKSTCGAGTVWMDKEKTKRHTLRLPGGEAIEDGGPNVIGFVMNIEQCSFVQACVILMNRVGIPIPEGKVDYKQDRHKKKMTRLNIDYCRILFKTPEVMSYLQERGISKESIKKWRLGYIPEDDTSAPMGAKVSGRLVFGLKEETFDIKSAKTVAMAYRTLKDEQPKYYNDYTIEGIYEKKQYIYGYNEARKAIRMAGYAIVTEGYTDVILAHQCQLENTIATCGTAFTKEQMEKLRRLTRNILFWYDGDAAGVDTMLENVQLLLEMGFRVEIVMADGKDPAEWMLSLNQEKDAILSFISEHARPALEVLAETIVLDYNTQVLSMRRQLESKLNKKILQALDELLPIYESITDPSDKLVFKKMIEDKLGVRV